jgi:flagellar basal-body rod modification protein FlgD
MSNVGNVSDTGYLSGLALDQRKETDAASTDKDMFMKLMLAQLEAQNPLEPQDGTEFVAQLAQFSTLEGIGNLNQSVNQMLSMYRSTQALQATTLVGREVLVSGGEVFLDPSTGVGGVIHPEGVAAGNVNLSVTDSSGQVVRSVELGNVGSQDTPFMWDGTDDNGQPLPPGNYQIAISGQAGGEHVALPISTYARVGSVSVVDNQGSMLLNLNGLGQISSADIMQVR